MANSTQFPIEEQLSKHARQHLDTLVKAGCDRLWIGATLHLLADFANDSWDHTTGLDEKKKIKKIGQELREWAADIQRLNDSKMFVLLYLGGLDADRCKLLPQELQWYASLLDDAAEHFGPRKKPLENAVKAILVARVKADTGRPHDREVAALIEAILPGKCSTEAHQMWRSNHGELVERIEQNFRQSSAPSQPPTPPQRA